VWPFAQPQRQLPEQTSRDSNELFRIPRQSRSRTANAAATQLENTSPAAAKQAIRWVEYWRLMTVKDGVSFPPALANQPHPKHRS
jgi:hypothetical protein